MVGSEANTTPSWLVIAGLRRLVSVTIAMCFCRVNLDFRAAKLHPGQASTTLTSRRYTSFVAETAGFSPAGIPAATRTCQQATDCEFCFTLPFGRVGAVATGRVFTNSNKEDVPKSRQTSGPFVSRDPPQERQINTSQIRSAAHFLFAAVSAVSGFERKRREMSVHPACGR